MSSIVEPDKNSYNQIPSENFSETGSEGILPKVRLAIRCKASCFNKLIHRIFFLYLVQLIDRHIETASIGLTIPPKPSFDRIGRNLPGKM